jgi:hypothetical protein
MVGAPDPAPGFQVLAEQPLGLVELAAVLE